ncbi:histidine kinase [Oceanobacillus caeni]|uniref:sensor histidine kinase n=1 Tax=Oceanobacillus caeni TaxID=405946 RepID=UPI000621481B|nr:sensor histidine kinase [Oceanobacillus caeni]KKE79682.1 histidine kinase [Bacilli bacterium VT-13-104]PZD89604.1 histidine kinase [Bacilli bacterium]MCR1833361.1 histidine kinase [Oceanobacillus caeni]PZD91126.1 histidine kinase [Bacilli bacterium]PZD92673.1 histidine kinase [Bacilli bacterium]
MSKKFGDNALDHIIDEMIDVVIYSKDEIFDISEWARSEYERLQLELKEIKKKVIQYIENGDQLEVKFRFSKQRLAEVSKLFDRYSEDEIRKVYEITHGMQTKLTIIRKEEKDLREKRDDIERRLVQLASTMERAERLASKITVVLNYLQEDFKQVNEVIEDAKEKQKFGLKIIEAQEEERRKISREIHDGPAQSLANILLRSELIEKIYLQGDVSKAMDEIKSIRGMIRSSLVEVRRIIYDLRPMALDDLGLVPTIKKYLSNAGEYNNIQIDFVMMGTEKRLNPKYEIAFFRLMQEALQNAIKHAEASVIQVKLEIGTNYLTLIVKDDGKGFNTELKKEQSFGLIGMKERVENLQGELSIQSEIGKGTVITIRVPYNDSVL